MTLTIRNVDPALKEELRVPAAVAGIVATEIGKSINFSQVIHGFAYLFSLIPPVPNSWMKFFASVTYLTPSDRSLHHSTGSKRMGGDEMPVERLVAIDVTL